MKKQNLKKSIRLFTFFLGLITLLSLISWNKYDDETTKSQKVNVKIENDKILNYFISHLNGEDNKYNKSKKI